MLCGLLSPSGALAVPDQLYAPSLDPGNTELHVSWRPPVTNASLVTDYDIQYLVSGTWTDWQSTTISTNTSTTITGLTNGTSYSVRVRAKDFSGDGPWSSSSSATAGTPSKPKLRIAAGSGQLAVDWDAPSNNGSAITGYNVNYRHINGGWTTHTHTGTGTSATISTLTNNVVYKVRVRAINSQGNGPWSPTASGTPSTSPSPTSENFTRIIPPGAARHNVLVSTFPYLDSGGSAFREVDIVSLPSAGKLVLKKCNRVLGSKCKGGYSYTDVTAGQRVGNENLQSSRSRTWLMFEQGSNFTSTTFTFKVVNAGSIASASTYTATLNGTPGKPTGVTATAGNTQVTLAWTGPSDTAISKWRYQQKAGNNAYGNWQDMPGSSASTRSHTVTGLTNTTAYKFKIRAVNKSVDGTISDEVSATPAAAVPSKPSNVRATGRDGEVLLTWNNPNDSSITGWQVRRKSTGAYGSWATISSSNRMTTSHTVDNLTNNTAYTFQVRAVNSSGNGTSSDEASATPSLPKPARTQNLRASGLDKTVYLAWTNPRDSSITKYQILVKNSTGMCKAWKDIPRSGAMTVSYYLENWENERTFFGGRKACEINLLSNGTEYTVQVRAVNAAGAGPESAEASATPAAHQLGQHKPKPPSNLQASGRNGSVFLLWSNPNDSSITGYKSAYRAVGDTVWTSASISGSGSTTTSHTVTNLTNGTEYEFQIQASNSAGAGNYSPTARATPSTAPGRPLNLTAQSGTTGITLSWRNPGDSSISGYDYRKRAGLGSWGSWTAIPGSGSTTTSYTVSTNLTQGAVNTFEVRAWSANGDSEASLVSALPFPAKPTGLTATAGIGSAALTWTNPSDGSISSYEVRVKEGTGNYGNWTAIGGSGSTTTSHTVASLTGNTLHTFQIRARNSSGAGVASDEVTATPQALPAAPTLTATPGDQQVTLSWTDPGDDSITSYQYQQKTTGDWPNDWTSISSSDKDTTSHTVSTLTNDTAYTFRVRAVSAVGNGPTSNEVSATPRTTPAKPTGLAASARHKGALLTWTNPNDTNISSYQFQSKSGSEEYSQWTNMAGSGASTTSYKVGALSKLDNGTAYTFRIRAVHSGVSGPASDEVTVTPAAKPAKPAGFAVAARHTAVVLSWTDPSDNTITEYEYRQKTGADGSWGSWTDISNSGATTTSHTVESLTNDTLYVFQIRAWNSVEAGFVSDEVSATPKAAPSAPSGVTAQVGDTSVTLSWTALDDSTVTKFQTRYKTNSTYGDWANVSSSGALTTSATVSGLTNSTAHTFQVRAVNQYGNGTASAEVTATPVPPPAAPTGLTTTALNGKVRLSWTDPSNTTITGYQYQQKTTGPWGVTWTDISNSGAATTSHTVDSLTNTTAYTFRIRAVNPAGGGASSAEVTATPVPPPAAPSGLTATALDQKVRLSWTDPSNSTITKYQYQSKTTSDWAQTWTDMTPTVCDVTTVTTSCTIGSLTNSTAHTFRIRAVNSAGEGSASAEVTATPVPPPAAPTSLTAAALDQKVRLSWANPNNSTITKYQYQQKTTGDYGSWTDMTSTVCGGTVTTSCTIGSLTNSTEHTFRIRAVNSAGEGSASAEVAATPEPPPEKPTGLSKSLTANGSNYDLALTWADQNDGTITSWEYQTRTSNTYGSTWTAISNSTASTTTMELASKTRNTLKAARIRAVNPSGTSTASDEVMVMPAQLAGLGAAAGDESVTLSWTSPGDTSISKYQYQKKAAGSYGNWTDMTNSVCGGAVTTSCTIGDLTNQTRYTFRVRSVNLAGDGAASSGASATPILPAPSGLTAAERPKGVYLSWTDPNISRISKYQVWVASGGNSVLGGWVDVSGSSASTTSVTVGNLDNGQEYTFKIRAWDTGAGTESSTVTATPKAAPAKPTGLTATVGTGTVALSWTNPSDSGITGYQVRYKTSTESDYGEWGNITNSDASTTSHTAENLEAGTTYKFQIRAVNSAGRGETSDAVTAVMAPAAPTGLQAVAKHQSVALSWTDPNDSSITEYEYRQKTTGGSYGSWTDMTSTVCGDTVTTSCTIGSLTNGTGYTFKIRAVNATGNGSESSEVSATPAPVPAKPAGLSKSLTANGSNYDLALSWTNPSNSTITSWQYQTRTISTYSGSWTTISNSGAGTTSLTLSNLAKNTLKGIRIRAVNPSGTGAISDDVPVQPVKLTGLGAVGKHQGVALSWTDPSDASISKYQYRQRAAGGNYGGWTDMPSGECSGADTTSCTITGLTNGTEYSFRIRAVSLAGESPISAEASATPVAVPARPTGLAKSLTANGSNYNVRVSWTNPNNSTITGWQYQTRTGTNHGISWTTIANSAANTAGLTLSNQARNTLAGIRIRAVNSAGESPPSVDVPVEPKQPAGFGATAKHQSVLLSWTDPDDSSISKYQYQQKVGGSYGSWTDMTNSVCGGAVTASCTISGLTNSTTYSFKIRAVNLAGESPTSVEASTTPVPVPAKPTGLSRSLAASGSNYNLTLSWPDPSNATVTGWQYQTRTGSTYGTTWTTVPPGGGLTPARSLTLSNKAENTLKGIRIRAVNSAGTSAASDDVSIVPAKPAGLTAAGGDEQVALSWTATSDGSVTGYEYRHKEGTGDYGNWTAMTNSSQTTASHTLTGLTNGVSYTAQIRALNLAGDGVTSDAAQVSTEPAQPAGFQGTAKHQSVVLSWTDPGDSSISKYQYQQKTTGDWGQTWTDMTSSVCGSTVTTSCTIGSLANNTAYMFRIRAVNPTGEGDASAGVTVTPIAVPVKPTGLSKSLTASSGKYNLTLSWTGPSNSTITHWEYQTRTGATYNGDPWTTVPSSVASTRQLTLSAQTRNTLKGIRIRAVNSAGESAASDNVPLLPSQPTGLGAVAKHQSAALSWTATSDDSVTGYEYRQKTDTYGNWTSISNSSQSTTNHTVGSLTNATEYTFQIRAVNPAGEGPASAEESTTPIPVPAKPTGLSKSLTASNGNYDLTLSWTNPSNATITHWEYQTRTGASYSGSWTTVPSSGASTTSLNLSAQTRNTLKGIRIRAVNTAGGSAASDDMPLLPAKPAGLDAVAKHQSVALSWTDPSDASITGYQYQQKTTGTWAQRSWTAISNSGADTTSHTVTDLTNETEYDFRIRAVNPAGEGPASEDDSVAPVPVPAQPTGLAKSLRGNGATYGLALSWTDPDNDTITSWQYQTRTGTNYGTTWTTVSDSGADTTSLSLSDDNQIQKNTLKAIRIRAVNSAGGGAASAEMKLMPAQPANLTAVGKDKKVVLSWTNPNDSSITEYEYQQKTTGDWGQTWTTMRHSGSGTTSYTVHGLTNGTEHSLRIRAVNAAADSAASATATATPKPVPAKPAGLTKSLTTPNSGKYNLGLSWTDPSNSTITSWQYQTRTGATYGSTWTTVSNSGPATTSLSLSNQDRNTLKGIRIRAVNSAGESAASNDMPLLPTLSLTVVAKHQSALLSWTDPDDESISGYQYKQNNGSWQSIPNSDADTTSHTVANLTNSSTYRFRIRAINPAGESAPSPEASTTPVPVPAKPTGLSRSLATAALGHFDLTLRWTNPNNSTITSWEYQVRAGDTYNGSDTWETIENSNATTAAFTKRLGRNAAKGIRIRAVNSAGESAVSDDLPLVPTEPTGLAATVRATGVNDVFLDLTWDKAGSTDLVSGWQVRRKLNTTGDYVAPWKSIPNSDADTVSHTVSGVASDSGYVIKIRAVNAAGNGIDSAEVSGSLLPAAPTNLASTVPDGAATLTWSNPSNPAITGYQYRFRLDDGDYRSWKNVPKSNANTTTVTISSGVSKKGTYEFQVRAVSHAGNGTAASTTKPSVPDSPTTLQAGVGNRAAMLTWDDPENATIDSYQYRQKTEDDSDFGQWRNIANSDAATTSHTATSLTNGTRYMFQVRAKNESGNGDSSGAAYVTPNAVPVTPAGLAARSMNEAVVLAWNDPGDATIDRYEYQQKTTGGNYPNTWTTIPNSGGTTTSYRVTGLSNGTSYTFRIRAANSAGESIPSADVSATPSPASVALALSPSSVGEAGGSRTITATATLSDVTGPATVTLSLEGSSTTDGSDYLAVNLPSISIPSGATEASATFTFSPVNDNMHEGDESYVLRASAAGVGGTGTATLTIMDDDQVPALNLSLSPSQVKENGTAVTVTATARLNRPSKEATALYLSKDSSSTADSSDYTRSALPGINIAAGATVGTGTFTVTPINDDFHEGDETLVLKASPVSGPIQGNSTATFYIRDDEDIRVLGLEWNTETTEDNPITQQTATLVTIEENVGTEVMVGVTITLDGKRKGDTTVTLAAHGSSIATADLDYATTGLPATIVIPTGEVTGQATFGITPRDDELSEVHETIIVTGSAAGTDSNAARMVITILDDEDPTVSLDLSSETVEEVGGIPTVNPITVTATTNRPVESVATVTVSVDDSSTATGSGSDADYATTGIPATITLPVGATSGTAQVTVEVMPDGVPEGDETIVFKGAGPDLLPGTATLTIVEKFLEEEKQMVSDVLTEVTANMLGSMRQVLTGRFANSPGGMMRVAGMELEFGEALDLLSESTPRDPFMDEELEDPAGFRISSSTWWLDTSFDYRLNAGAGPPGRSGTTDWSIWGQGDYIDFSGRTDGNGSYDGDVRTAYLGVDARIDGEWVAGLAVSHSRGHVDYRLEGEGLTGSIKTRLTSAHPYASVSWGDGHEAWAMLGLGDGTLEMIRGGEDNITEESDLSTVMGSAGFRSELVPDDGEGVTWSLVADVSYAEVETDEGDGTLTIDDLTVDMHQIRAGVEYACAGVVDNGITESYVQAYARYDGGDGTEGAGLELVGGLRFIGTNGWEVDAQGRWLAAHADGDKEERGVSLSVRKSWDENQRGLYLQLSPQWGAPTESSAAMWNGDALRATDQTEYSLGDFTIRAEAGYGTWLEVLERPVTWFGETECSGYECRRGRLGVRFGATEPTDSGLTMEMFGEYDGNGPGSGLGLQIRIGFRF